MPTVRDVSDFLESFAPLALAEEWDNVGLLVGDPQSPAKKVMTCLTITPFSADEAVDRGADLIVTHHPLPFRGLKRITTETTAGRLLWQLMGHGISIYSPHTAFDSAARGINQQWSMGLGLAGIRPLIAHADEPTSEHGAGRCGSLSAATSLDAFARRIKDFLGATDLRLVGASNHSVTHVAIACGSGGEFLDAALKAGCDLLITGETSFHTCLEAEANGIALVLVGHFASERFAVVTLADELTRAFPGVEVWPSGCERDPLRAG